MRSASYIDTFVSLCDGRDEMTVGQVRKIVLLATDGQCPANLLLDAEGRPLTMRAVCANTHTFVAQHTPSWSTSSVNEMMASEAKAMKTCSMDVAKHDLLASSIPIQRTLSLFRRLLLAKVGSANVKAIHFFRSDGSCRSTRDEIIRAMLINKTNNSSVRLGANASFWSDSPRVTQGRTDEDIFNESARNVAQKEPVVMLVLGLGCSSQGSGLKRWQEYIEGKHGVHAQLYCNQSLINTLTQIGKNYLGHVPRMKDAFPQYIYAEIKKYLQQNHSVILIGHSYGGAIVSRIAQFLSSKRLSTPALHLVTLGSIYVPPLSQTVGTNIKHHMFYRDVALKANKLKPDQDTFVHWMRSKVDNEERMTSTLFGSALEWEIPSRRRWKSALRNRESSRFLDKTVSLTEEWAAQPPPQYVAASSRSTRPTRPCQTLRRLPRPVAGLSWKS